MAEPKTRPTDADVDAFLDEVPDVRRREEGRHVRELFERVTGEPPVMWGPTMVGFGTCSYTVTTGTHEMFVVGFSPRKGALTLYGLHDGYGPPDPLLEKLGQHTVGKACLYVKRLSDVDEQVLEQLVRNAWESAQS